MKNIGIVKINEVAEKISGCIRFDKGSGKLPFPEEFFPAIEKVKKEIKGKYFHYPVTGGEESLKKEIVKIEKKHGRNIFNDNITITHGGMSGLFNVFYALSKKGDEVIINKYSFEGFSLLIDHFGMKAKRVDLGNEQELRSAITVKTKFIIFNSPENPTGKIYSRNEIEAIIKLSQEKNIWLVSDEVMSEVTYKKWSCPDLSSNVIIINSFSKCWFIPGVRVGWVVAKDKSLINKLSSLISISSLGVNIFGQMMMAEVLASLDYSRFIEKKISLLETRKKLVERYLNEKEIKYLHDVQGGMSFYIDLKKDSQEISKKLLRKGVALIPGYLFEGKKSKYARLGFGAVSENEIKKGIEIIKTVIGK
jgi:aspartate/methionine/tyrosine aminotransferase